MASLQESLDDGNEPAEESGPFYGRETKNSGGAQQRGKPWLARTITVTRSKDEGLVGLKGMIVHETKRTLRVRSPKGVHVIAKDVISFTLDGSDLVIEGSEVLQKPEDRVSRRYRRNR